MNSVTVITSTIGRLSLLKLAKTLSEQEVKVVHLVMWDKKKIEGGLLPNDERLNEFINDNYSIYHYDIKHPFNLTGEERVDNNLRAVGVSLSNTEYITLIDDDCWVEKNWFVEGIECIKKNNLEYCYAQRYIWKDEEERLGYDNYESIGCNNKLGYDLIDMNTLLYHKCVKRLLISLIFKYNSYKVDRELCTYLSKTCDGKDIKKPFLNQISPDFLLKFHTSNIKKYNN